GRDAGRVDDERWDRFCRRRSRFDRNLCVLETTPVRASSGDRVPAAQLLRQPEIRLVDLIAHGVVPHFESEPSSAAIDIASAETTTKYAGYLRRQQAENEPSRKAERRRIPPAIPFERVPGLSGGAVQLRNTVGP